MRRLALLATFTAIGLALLALVGTPAAAAPKLDPPKRFYLPLGDSVAYGYQQWKVDAHLPPSAFDTGYVDDFAARLRTIRPGIRVVNYGCPRESTASFLAGPCPENALGFPLHDPFTGSQLAAATAFLHAHRGQVSPITLTLGGQDVNDLVDSCGGELGCIRRGAPAEAARLSANLRTILAKLRAAAPDAEIVVTGPWDGNVGLFAFADPLFAALDWAVADATAAERACYADLFPVFDPQGDEAAETAAICELTSTCADGDGHPSDQGYRAIAEVVLRASGYARLAGS
jgi:lysophospholipase L1-like esterase